MRTSFKFDPAKGGTTPYEAAAAYIAKGKNKHDRPIASNTFLRRTADDRIAVVYYSTAIVTYCADGTAILYCGGWNTVSTKTRWSQYAPKGGPWSRKGKLVVGYTGELTSPRVQKCRLCKGTGKGGGWWDNGHVGAGLCFQCKGDGRYDYGSNPVPIFVDTYDAWRVDADGKYIETVDSPTTGYAATVKTTSYAKAQTDIEHGGEIVAKLAEVVPGIRATAKHPVTAEIGPIHEVIVSLNDSHHWTRERVADWLETLDVDLRFTA